MTEVSGTTARSVLWWSRGGRDYSRDRIVRNAFRSLGWNIQDFRPRVSQVGDLEASLRRTARPDVVWVPCFRQRDAAAARRWATRHNVPLVLDPLISAWDKQVFERRKFDVSSRSARRLLHWESRLFRAADIVVADTQCHAEFFCEAHGVESEKTAVIPVSAEETIFRMQPSDGSNHPIRALFYGSFIGLQGPQYIAEAARQTDEVNWTFIGSGPLLSQCHEIAGDCSHVQFVSRIPYETLPDRIADADILLGVFGTSEKANRVIPNKVYQALACGRPVVTREANAWPHELRAIDDSKTGVTYVPPGNPQAIAAAVRYLAQPGIDLSIRSRAARATFEQHFSESRVQAAVQRIIEKLRSPLFGASRAA